MFLRRIHGVSTGRIRGTTLAPDTNDGNVDVLRRPRRPRFGMGLSRPRTLLHHVVEETNASTTSWRIQFASREAAARRSHGFS